MVIDYGVKGKIYYNISSAQIFEFSFGFQVSDYHILKHNHDNSLLLAIGEG